MSESFPFIMLAMLTHLVLGGFLVYLTSIVVSKLALNATTRHNIWILVLILLVLMPLAALLPAAESVNNKFGNVKTPVLESRQQSPDSSFELPSGLFSPLQPQSALSTQTSPEIIHQPGTVRSYVNGFSKSVISFLSESSFLNQLVNTVILLVTLGILIKFCIFGRSYLNLLRLYRSAEASDSRWTARFARLANQVGVSSCPELKISNAVTSPLTSGTFRHWVVLPQAWIVGKEMREDFIDQALIHELAHVKRRDPLVATFQALIEVFAYWHPGISYVNTQIRFERELACDDWVIQLSGRSSRDKVKSFANGLLNLATSLPKETMIHAQSVACVQSSRGLATRLKLLLNPRVNHSVSTLRQESAVMAALMFQVFVVSIAIWPRLPAAQAADSLPAVFSLEDVKRLAPHSEGSSSFISGVDKPEIPSISAAQEHASHEPDDNKTAMAVSSVSEPVGYEAGSNYPEPNLEPPVFISSTGNYEANSAYRQIRMDREQIIEPLQLPSHDLISSNQALVDHENIRVSFPENHNEDFIDSSAPTFSDDASVPGSAAIEQLSAAELEKEIDRVENEFYQVFNANTKDKMLKIHCGKYRPSYSLITDRFCEPAFLIEARSRTLQSRLLHNEIIQETTTTVVNNNLADFNRLTEAMNSLLSTSSYFRELNSLLQIMKARLEEIS